MMEKNTLKSIKIRKLMAKDITQIVRIQEAITKVRISPKKKALLRKHIQKNGSIGLVALKEGNILGYVISEVMTDSFGLDQSGWIQNLGVHPKSMGQGIGQTLAAALFEAFKKKKIFEIYTAVQWNSVDLLSFFKSIGFDRSNFINLYKRLEPKE